MSASSSCGQPSDPPAAGSPSPVRSPAQARLGRLSLRNMAISLGVLVVPVVVAVLISQAVGDQVVTTDPGPAISDARTKADYPLRVPGTLPEGWRVSSATTRIDSSSGDRATVLRIGYVAPSGGPVQLVESDEAADAVLAREIGTGRAPTGALSVDGRAWQRYPGRFAGESALVLLDGAVTIVVTGRAPAAELEALASSLR
jgi:hypothetical protein